MTARVGRNSRSILVISEVMQEWSGDIWPNLGVDRATFGFGEGCRMAAWEVTLSKIYHLRPCVVVLICFQNYLDSSAQVVTLSVSIDCGPGPSSDSPENDLKD
jgi:hypothetical protein